MKNKGGIILGKVCTTPYVNEELETDTYDESFKKLTRMEQIIMEKTDGETRIQCVTEWIYCAGHLSAKKIFKDGELIREDIYAGTGKVNCAVHYSKGKVTRVYYPETNREVLY